MRGRGVFCCKCRLLGALPSSQGGCSAQPGLAGAQRTWETGPGSRLKVCRVRGRQGSREGLPSPLQSQALLKPSVPKDSPGPKGGRATPGLPQVLSKRAPWRAEGASAGGSWREQGMPGQGLRVRNVLQSCLLSRPGGNIE